MKNIISTFILISGFLFFGFAKAQDDSIPKPPNPPRLVNDYVGLLNATEANALEQKLVKFNDSTSNQIVIIITGSLAGYEPAEFADRLGEKWGVGQGKFDNGVVILIKPTGGQGEKKTHIAVGYGLEGVIPDAIAKRIVENEMIPNFKNGNFYQGLDAATSVLMGLAAGEFTYADYQKKHARSPFLKLIPILIFVIIFILMRVSRRKHYTAGGSLPFWTAFWLMGSGSGGGSWGNFSSGSGGFGGFGGGGFGGGGAGGSW